MRPTRGRGKHARQTIYGPVNIAAILGDAADAIDRYVSALSASWGDTWTEGMLHALDSTDFAQSALLDIRPSDFDPLVGDSRLMVDYDRDLVTAYVLAAIEDGQSPGEVQQGIMALQSFTPARAMRIARTEVVRAQESGYDRRVLRAVATGLNITGNEWMSDPLAAQWPRRHDLLDGKTAPVGGMFTMPISGVESAGPGLSGQADEDIHCRCARRPVVRRS